MPAVLIETRCQRSVLDECAIIDAVHQALVYAFKIPSGDKNVRLLAHEPHRFACPPGRTEPALYTYVSVDAFSGRSLDAKRTLYQCIVTSLESLGIPPDHITVVLREAPTTNWGIRGGQAACDINLGFAVNV
jgi:phenylpyruvate tautomerase PptA (4-oxalocrotonate tautomerase family)